MKLARLFLSLVLSCAGAPPAAPAADTRPAPEAGVEEATADDDAGVEEAAEPEAPSDAAAPVVVIPNPASLPRSTASYDEALATPERLDVNDNRPHLSDIQLTGPMRSVLATCRIPPTTKVTIKTVVQYGRAIGVTVVVNFPAPKRGKRRSAKAAKAEAKAKAKIVSCADAAVRGLSWPPSSRRDSFTTTF